MEKKKLVINCAICDARKPSENTLEKYEDISINSATVLVTPESEELLAQYPVNINSSDTISVPEKAPLQVVNGKLEIGADTVVSEGTVLVINGKVTVLSGGENNLKKYSHIIVNGKMLCPDSIDTSMGAISVNGKIETYPTGAIILKNDFVVDKLFVLRAKPATYWSNRFIFVDSEIESAALSAKGTAFFAKSAVVAESLAEGIVPMLNESCDIIIVPDKTAFVDKSLELNDAAVMRFGTKLFVADNLEISAESADALSKLEYLYVDGKVSLAESLQQAFYSLKAHCDDVSVVKDRKAAKITDKISVKIDKYLLEAHPEGIFVTDCVTVKIAKDVTPELIAERLSIEDCANVSCCEEQESALSLVCEDVANMSTQEGEGIKGILGVVGSAFGELKDTKMINAAEYKL